MRDVSAPKVSEFHRDEFIRMHKELTDDEYIEEYKRKTERIKRIEDKKVDTGIYEKPKHRQIY